MPYARTRGSRYRRPSYNTKYARSSGSGYSKKKYSKPYVSQYGKRSTYSTKKAPAKKSYKKRSADVDWVVARPVQHTDGQPVPECFSGGHKYTKFGMRLMYVTEPECPLLKGESFKSDVKWKGVTQRLTIEVEPNQVLFHRRIVFNFPGDLDDLPLRKMTTCNQGEEAFLGCDMSYGCDDGTSKVLCDFLFTEATVSGMMNGPLDRKNVNILEDKVHSYAGGDTGRMLKKTYYNSIECTVLHEALSGSSPFHGVSPKSKGHPHFILDVFRHGIGNDIPVGKMTAYQLSAKEEKDKNKGKDKPKAEASDIAMEEPPSGPFPTRKRAYYFSDAKAQVRTEYKMYWYK